MTRRNIVGTILSRFNYNRVTVTIVHISVREWLRDFELQAQAFKAALIPTMLEERARLTDSAEMKYPGCCPHGG